MTALSTSTTHAQLVRFEGDEYPIIFVQDVPPMRYHGAPLHFMSEAGMSQDEYKHAAITQSLPPTEDDTILIKCPNLKDGTGQQFEVSRSVLSRSPTFAAFFQSPNYLHGSRTLLTFMSDPAVCFEIIQQYLTEGSEVYNKTRLRVFVTIRYKIVERLLVLIRLHALAHKLALPDLEGLAFDTIVELDRYIKPEYCITLASLVFTSKAGFQPSIKSWCLGHVAKSFHFLRENKDWNDILWLLDVELFMQWERWMSLNPAILPSNNSSADGRMVEEIMVGIPVADLAHHEAPHSIVEEILTRIPEEADSTVQMLDKERNTIQDESDDESSPWSNSAEPPPAISQQRRSTHSGDSPERSKAKSMFGMIDESSNNTSSEKSSTESDETSMLLMMERQRVLTASPPTSPTLDANRSPTTPGFDTAKAREVMGLSPSSPSSPRNLPSPKTNGGWSSTPQRRGSHKRIVQRIFQGTPSRLGK